MTPNLRIQLLGEFRLFVDDQALTTVNKPRQQALLAYLLLHRHAPQSRRQMAFAFWPESTEAQAYTNLRKIVFQLRHALPNFEELLVGDAQNLGCRQDASFALDVADLEQALDTLGNGDKVLADSTALAASIEQIVALYRGELLPTCYDEWLLLLRRHLHERVVNALSQALARLAASEQPPIALRAAEHLLRLDPLHEAAYRHLMRLRASSGDRSGALRAYQECVALLERELEVAPAIETVVLYQDILREHLDARRVEEPGPHAGIVSGTPLKHNLPVQLTSFVGREKELDALDELLTSDDMRLITIVGPGGMGKTRLALATAQRQLVAEIRSRANTFAHGVYFVALAPLSEAAQIVPAVATALGFAIDSSGGQSRSPEQQLLDYLREKQMLLVLDNFEHLLDGVALLIAIRQTAPAIRLLITSREHLRLPGAHVDFYAGSGTSLLCK